MDALLVGLFIVALAVLAWLWQALVTMFRRAQGTIKGRVVLASLVLVALVAYRTWQSSGSGSLFTAEAEVMTVLAGSELRDLEPFFEDIARETGVQLELNYIGTLDGVDAIVSGREVDAAWFSHGKYLALVDRGRIAAQETIMLSPVVMGIKQSLAEDWGWTDGDVTWQDIADRAESGELEFAMTNPASSNSGFTALMGVVAAFADTADAPQLEDIETAAPRLTDFFAGQALTSGSSGWLAESYVREQDRLDGLVNYESVLLELNESGQLREPLHLLYPAEGIVTADYPLMLLNNDKREDFDKLVAYLRSEDFQRRMMSETQRRPVIPQVPLADSFPNDLLIELPFPGSGEVVESILFAYLDEVRIPSHAVFVLDVSGSMEGERIAQLKEAVENLTGLDDSLTGRFARFSARERVTLVPFRGQVQDAVYFDIDNADADSDTMQQIRNYVSTLQADGGTAIYSSLAQAYRYLENVREEDQSRSQERYYSIVLMSDGENTEDTTLRDFERFFTGLAPTTRVIKTFPVLFGNANEEEMIEVAELTGGRVFDGRSEALSLVFKQIRGYQ